MSTVFTECKQIVNELVQDYTSNGNNFDGVWDETQITPANALSNIVIALKITGSPSVGRAPALGALAPPPPPPAAPGALAPPTVVGGFAPAQIGGGPDFGTLVYTVMSGDNTIHNGKTIINVPTANELLLRIVTPLWYESIGIPIAAALRAVVTG